MPRRASGVLLARRGLPGADRWLAPMLDEALEDARRPPAAVTSREVGERAAVVEWCWLDGRTEDCRPLAEALLARAQAQPLDLDAAELMRWLLRVGLLDAESPAKMPIPGVPEAFAAGLRADRRAPRPNGAASGRPTSGRLS